MSEWISVDDSFPEPIVEVLVFRPLAHESHDPAVKISFRLRNGAHRMSPRGVDHCFDCWCHVTHWMPLPEPPECKQ